MLLSLSVALMDALTIAAASGIRSRMESLDLLANNLANSATAGFKRDQEFYGLFSSMTLAAGAEWLPAATLPVIQRQWTDFSPGDLQVTGNPMDVALSGSGFFAVNGPNGPLYTRNGNLQVLPSGELATADGYPLRNTSGKTIKVSSGQPIEIATDGTVQQGGQSLGPNSGGDLQVHGLANEDGQHSAFRTAILRTCRWRRPMWKCNRERSKARMCRWQRPRCGWSV